MKKHLETQFAKNKTEEIINVCVIVACLLYIIADPVSRHNNQDILWLTGYKPYLYSARDFVFALSGLSGAICMIIRPNKWGWIGVNVFSIGIITSYVFEFIASILYHQSMLGFGISIIVPISIIVLNFIPATRSSSRPNSYVLYWLSFCIGVLIVNYLLMIFRNHPTL